MLKSLSDEQKRIFVDETGFEKLVSGFNLNENIPPAFLQWLYKRIDPHTMCIRVGPGKKLKITKEVFHRILGLAKIGDRQEKSLDCTEKNDEAKTLRKQLGIKDAKDFDPDWCIEHVKKKGTDGLTRRCFFLVLFNCLLFSTGSWQISNLEVMRTADMSNFNRIDWCHEIYNFFLWQVELFSKDLQKPQTSYTIPGCSVAVAVRI